MTNITIHREFGWVVMVLVLYVILNTYMSIMVYLSRTKYKVPYPTLYALQSDNPEANLFNCVQRGHQNSLEFMPIFFVLLLLGGIQHPWISVGFGLFYVITRFFYFTGYSTGNPDNRLQIGEWNLLALLGHLALTVSFAVHVLT